MDALLDEKGNVEYNAIGADEVLKYLFDLFKTQFRSAAVPFFSLFGLVIICSLFSNYSALTKNGTAAKTYGFLSSLCLGITISGVLTSLWDELYELSGKLTSLINAISLSTVSIYAFSGNVTEAAVNRANIAIFVSFISGVFKYGLFPVLQICFAFSFISSVTDLCDLSSLSALVRRIYTSVIVFIMGVFTTVISVRQVLASRADTMLVRGVKMAAGSFIPIVGNAVGEAARVVSAGLGSLKSSVGVICIAALIICVLPLFIKMLVTKTSFLFGAVFADVLGLKREAAFIRSGSELLNFSLALISSVSTVFIINLMIFAGSSTAIGG
ncbi:MAG: hypothetical protein IJR90_06855 [Clostridia bacterium]|nr:hypothetical protein [Clostridia bacterium]